MLRAERLRSTALIAQISQACSQALRSELECPIPSLWPRAHLCLSASASHFANQQRIFPPRCEIFMPSQFHCHGFYKMVRLTSSCMRSSELRARTYIRNMKISGIQVRQMARPVRAGKSCGVWDSARGWGKGTAHGADSYGQRMAVLYGAAQGGRREAMQCVGRQRKNHKAQAVCDSAWRRRPTTARDKRQCAAPGGERRRAASESAWRRRRTTGYGERQHTALAANDGARRREQAGQRTAPGVGDSARRSRGKRWRTAPGGERKTAQGAGWCEVEQRKAPICGRGALHGAGWGEMMAQGARWGEGQRKAPDGKRWRQAQGLRGTA
eukprot:6172752-Pleurochrysis_carterae.AAC.2